MGEWVGVNVKEGACASGRQVRVGVVDGGCVFVSHMINNSSGTNVSS